MITMAVVAMAAALSLGGCSAQPPDTESETASVEPSCPPVDPDAQTATITLVNGGFEVSPPILLLSLAAQDRAQWSNQTDSTVTIALIGSPVLFEIAPHGVSSSLRVNPKADTMRYDYKVFGPSGSGPQPPQIEVGP
jgi:hypothetical protein